MKSHSFLWGAATSAHQVEGNNIHNDWWAWEQKLPPAQHSGLACDHYHRYPQDFALAKHLGHNAHRLSLEWSRIEPAAGAFNERAIEHYRQVLTELRRQQLTSFVTLHHFTNPIWFARAGGWLRLGAAAAFARYVKVVAQRLGDLVDYWITINEPMVYATQSYWYGNWPPHHHRNWLATQRVILELARAHRRSYDIIHQRQPAARVGLAQHVTAFYPASEQSLPDVLLADFYDWWYNHWFIHLTAGRHDFLGINYYRSLYHRWRLFPWQIQQLPWTGATSDIQWPIHPEGLTHELLHSKPYGLPIYITENGLADANDSRRADFIRDHLRAIEAAQSQGAPVRGYFHWSLLDNFEWTKAFTPRFGLVEVNYHTLERQPRPSAYVLKAIIEQRQL